MSSDGQLQALHDGVTKALVGLTRTANQIGAEDLTFLRASDPAARRELDKRAARLLRLTRRVVASGAAATGSDVAPPQFSSAEALEDRWPAVVEVLDGLLERADVLLDEYTGAVRKLAPGEGGEGEQARARGREGEAQRRRDGNVQRSDRSKVPKPQLLFKEPPRNHETTPFKPLLKKKPHAKVSLKKSLVKEVGENKREVYKHPYEAEINEYDYPAEVRQKKEPIQPNSFEDTDATFVDTLDGAKRMLSELREADIIAVDLEHHDKHSYIGLVSLMQISTREKDWIVDTLQPWRQELQMLNEVFANPAILKVFHGATMDIVWLQRDLGLYVVGLFDTYHASRALRYPRASLAFLLQKFVEFEAQKQHQLADWRIRPLPKEMFDYARSDTHFLLYIYDMMRNELIENSDEKEEGGDLVQKVLDESKNECLRRFERPIYDKEEGIGPNGWYGLLIRTPALFNKYQFAVFRAVHHWRDELAREEDEAPFVIMPNNVIFNISREMPAERSSFFGCAHPISDAVRNRVSDLLSVIKKAKAAGENGPEMDEFLQKHPSAVEMKTRTRKSFPQPQTTFQQSVGDVIKREREKLNPATNENARSQESQFWGSAAATNTASSKSKATPPRKPLEIRLQVPLPPLTAEIYADGEDGAVTSPITQPTSKTEPPPATTPTEDEPFVLQKGTRKRKRRNQESSKPQDQSGIDEVEANGDVVALESDEESSDNAKGPRKKQEKAGKQKEKQMARRARKDEKKKRKAETEAKKKEADGDEAFDYANAPSVLEGKGGANGNDGAATSGGKGKRGKKGGENPYAAKLLDTPKGARKVKKEFAGKSSTFKK